MQFRQAILQVACATVLLSTAAQAQVVPPSVFIPSPVGSVLSVGVWIYNNATRERVYVVEVQGEGKTTEESRQNGFRIAVESAVGSIMSSESVAQNNKLARDEIIMYSAGFVERYEIVRQEAGGLGVKTTMKVWIRRNPIANRLLNQSETAGEIKGSQASVSFDSLVQERKDGDRLANSVIADAVRMGFDIIAGKPQVTFDGQDRTATFSMPYTMNWNQEYLKSLWSALDATQSRSDWVSTVTVKFPGLSFSKTARYADEGRYRTLMSTLFFRKPVIRMRLLDDQNRVVYEDTFPVRFFTPSTDPAFMYRPALIQPEYGNQRGVQINGNVTIRDNLLIQNVDTRILERVTRVDLRLI